jgi:hypothetical protein
MLRSWVFRDKVISITMIKNNKILHCQSVTIIYFTISSYFLFMTWKIKSFWLIVNVKLIYTDNVHSLNSSKREIKINKRRYKNAGGKKLILVQDFKLEY